MPKVIKYIEKVVARKSGWDASTRPDSEKNPHLIMTGPYYKDKDVLISLVIVWREDRITASLTVTGTSASEFVRRGLGSREEQAMATWLKSRGVPWTWDQLKSMAGA